MTRITNRGSGDYKTGQLLGITNRGGWDYKSEQFQRLQNRAKGLKIGAGITKRGKDYKSVQDTCTRSSEIV